ncbi:hypothetical protein [Vibrio diabolicus]|uniref:hypothetical protein n=1 Tax=Vibrio diabolicus TaxID=50719 RepID=UPI0037534A03
MTAAFIVYVLKVNSFIKLKRVVLYSVFFQLCFWVVTFLSPELKMLLYKLIGATDSPNINEQNLLVRGFGLSSEINFITPFMMVFLVFYFSRSIIYRVTVVLTQIINSNMAIISSIIMLFYAKWNLIYKIFSMVLVSSLILVLSEKFLPRFYSEFVDNGGMRTISILLENHLIFLNKGFFEVIFGTSRAIFHGADVFTSDIGWIITYNYGGVFLILLIVSYFSVLIYKASNNLIDFILLAAFFVILNTKGLVFGVNGFVFLLHVLMFVRHFGENKLNGKVNV